MFVGKPVQPQWFVDPESLSFLLRNRGCAQQLTGTAEADQEAIEQRIQIGTEQKSVKGSLELGRFKVRHAPFFLQCSFNSCCIHESGNSSASGQVGGGHLSAAHRADRHTSTHVPF